jgi:hypothetical protein
MLGKLRQEVSPGEVIEILNKMQNTNKSARGEAQVVEYLPGIHEDPG